MRLGGPYGRGPPSALSRGPTGSGVTASFWKRNSALFVEITGWIRGARDRTDVTPPAIGRRPWARDILTREQETSVVVTSWADVAHIIERSTVEQPPGVPIEVHSMVELDSIAPVELRDPIIALGVGRLGNGAFVSF
jgi:hypothetical protein